MVKAQPRGKLPHLTAAEEMGSLFREMGDRLLWIVVVLGAATVAANTWRAFKSNSWTTYVVDVSVYVGVVGALSLRRRLAPQTVFSVILGLIFLEGYVRLATLGLGGAGSMILGASCAFVGIFFGVRSGLYAVGAALLGFAMIGIAHGVGWLVVPPEVSVARQSPQSWLTHGGLLAGFSASVVIAANSVQRRLLRSLADLRRREAELQKRTAELQARTRELRTALSELRESERKYRLVSEQVTDLVFVQGLDGLPRYVSPSAQALFGYSVEELLELPMARLMTPESAVRAAEDVRRYLALCREGPVDVPLLEYEYVRKDGRTFWGELKVGFLRDERNEVTGLQGVLRDISWRKQAEQERERLSSELRQAEKMQAIGQLASGVAHDFNNQLTVIQGYADMLGADRSSALLTRRAAEQIAAAARRSADLTEQLLAFGRRSAARTVALDLHQTIAEAVRLLERSVDPRIRIRTELGASPSVVVGDPTLLCTALLNLGLNARDAMPEGGEIVFSTALAEPIGAPAPDLTPGIEEAAAVETSAEEASTRKPSWIEVRVTDTGLGMDEQTLRRAFEPFFTTKPAGRGTGMGLAAVYGTVSAHGGTVQADSSPRRGTSVTIRLPLSSEGTAAPASSRSDEAVPTAALRVLLVDDEPQICELAQQILEQGGLRVHAFTDAVEAIRFFEAHADEVELAVLDLTMPAMTGTRCLAALQRVAPGLPALFISGNAPSELARHLIEQRRCGFLPKPFRAADLLASARRAARLSGSNGTAEAAQWPTNDSRTQDASDAGARHEP